jgi:peptidyl-tRNA hydrolase, PTH2 family
MNIKQVIVVRTKYPDGKEGFFKPRTGKLIAQGAHASMKVLLDRGDTGFVWRSGKVQEFDSYDDDRNPGDKALLVRLTDAMQSWITGIFTKVVVGCDSEEELRALLSQAEVAGLPCALIEDSGATEFHGVKTPTCIAIGPADADAIDAITGELKLL